MNNDLQVMMNECLTDESAMEMIGPLIDQNDFWNNLENMISKSSSTKMSENDYFKL